METNELQQKYQVDVSTLTKKRPIGVTGILRCRNSADFLEACIDSCIDGLDELVAVYHDCTDETPLILMTKQAQYPNKIKVYEYEPYVMPVEFDGPTALLIQSLPFDSIHLVSGYSNYALSKVTYRYVVKIDADQVYFSKKWKRLCNAYKSDKKVKITTFEYVAYGLYNAYKQCFEHGNIHRLRLFEKIVVWLYPFYFSYVEKRVIKEKTAVSLSGINLFRINRRWKVGLGNRQNPVMSPLFNGVHDLFFFELSEHTFYEKWKMFTTLSKRKRLVEIMHYPKELLDGGFFWFHLKPVMRTQKKKSLEMYKESPYRFMSFEELRKTSYRRIKERLLPFFGAGYAEPMFSYFHTATRKNIPWSMLDDLGKKSDKEAEQDDWDEKRDCWYREFTEELKKCLVNFVNRQEERKLNSFKLGKYDIKESVMDCLSYQLVDEREHYSQCRGNGLPIDAAMKRVRAFLALLENMSVRVEKDEVIENVQNHPWHAVLSGCKNQVLVYVSDEEQLQKLVPFIKEINNPILLLSDYELPDEIDLPDYVTALTIAFSDYKAFANAYIECCFPFLYQYATTFSFLLRILQPQQVVCLREGCVQGGLLVNMVRWHGVPFMQLEVDLSTIF